jgi:hypothetical protein
MKKLRFSTIAVAAMMMAGCGTGFTTTTGGSTGSVLGDVLSGVVNGGAIDAIASIIGATKMTQQSLQGSWKYSGPGCAFTSEKLLAKAGGEVVAAQIKQKMLPTYQTLGLSASNTFVQFNADNTFSASFGGKQFSGTYTFDPSTSKVVLKSLLFNINCYAKKNTQGIALLFEASKLLNVLQMVSAMSGNATLGTIGDLSKNYDGVRLGFDFK